MFILTIYNTETKEEFIEIINDHKELDEAVESMYDVYGDSLQIDIRESEEEMETKRFSEKPLPLSSEDYNSPVEEPVIYVYQDLILEE